MAVQYTASAASGYLTDVAYIYLGNMKAFTAHYSAPSASSAYVDVGMHKVVSIYIEDADASTYGLTSNSVGGVYVLFSGVAAGSTGRMFIVGY